MARDRWAEKSAARKGLKLKFSPTFCGKYLESWDRDEDLLGIFLNVMGQRMNMSFGV